MTADTIRALNALTELQDVLHSEGITDTNVGHLDALWMTARAANAARKQPRQQTLGLGDTQPMPMLTIRQAG